MRSDKEIAREALRRGKLIAQKKAERKRRIYGLCSVAACLAVVIVLAFALPNVDGGAGIEGLYAASVFAGGSVGGYALIGVIGFVLGAVVVIFYKKNKEG
jgi:hypothetical protein